MGLGCNFNKFLLQHAPGAFRQIHISEYAFEKVAVDTSLYMHKFKAIHGEKWLDAFLGLVMGLRQNQVHSVFIFDGEAPEEKKTEKERRKSQKDQLIQKIADIKEAYEIYKRTGEIPDLLVQMQKRRRSPPKVLPGSASIFNPETDVDVVWLERTIAQKENQLYEVDAQDYLRLQELLDIINVSWYVAQGEAEKMGAYLVRTGQVCSILTEDTDVMAYGSPSYLCRYDPFHQSCVQVTYAQVLKEIQFTPEMFLDFCIMCGTDYNKNVPGVGSVSAYKKLQTWKSIEAIQDSHPTLDLSVLNYQAIRRIFQTFPDYGVTDIPYSGPVSIPQLKAFMVEHGLSLRADEELQRSLAQKTQIILEDTSP